MKRTTCLVCLLLWTGQAHADGMIFQNVDATTAVRATDQRAVMWKRSGTWEIHIQPVFDRDAGQAAWVVPFPVEPQVQESDADLFDQLELITSPVIVETCWESSSGGIGCFPGSKDGAANLQEGQEGDTSVVVWQQGTVGELDYVVLSATEGDDLVAWMDTEGYEIPDGASDLLASYDTEGVFFFVARLSSDADPSVPLVPVRFVLPDMETPIYPMRLTSFGAPEGVELELTLWLVFPEADPYLPESPYWGELSEQPTSIEEFDTLRDQFHDTRSEMLMRGSLSHHDLANVIDTQQFCTGEWYACVSFDALGIDPPATWADEFAEMRSSSSHVVRFEGRFSASEMAQDITLAPVSYHSIPWHSNVWEVNLGDCENVDDDDSDCSISPLPGSSSGLAAFIVLGLLAAALAIARRLRG